MQAGDGGENIFVDGFKIAAVLREKHPDYYDLLTTTRFMFQDKGQERDTGQFYNNTCMRYPIEWVSSYIFNQ